MRMPCHTAAGPNFGYRLANLIETNQLTITFFNRFIFMCWPCTKAIATVHLTDCHSPTNHLHLHSQIERTCKYTLTAAVFTVSPRDKAKAKQWNAIPKTGFVSVPQPFIRWNIICCHSHWLDTQGHAGRMQMAWSHMWHREQHECDTATRPQQPYTK